MNTASVEDARMWQLWREAAAGPTVDEALRSLYAQVDAAVTRRGPTCWVSGRCCKFDSFGHRLYVTGLEIAWFLGQGPSISTRSDSALPILAEAPSADACPYQIGGLCSTHAIRPLGCRIFFCQQGTETWQQELYESFLTRLRTLHDEQDLPYRYMEWREGLREGAEAGVGSGAETGGRPADHSK